MTSLLELREPMVIDESAYNEDYQYDPSLDESINQSVNQSNDEDANQSCICWPFRFISQPITPINQFDQGFGLPTHPGGWWLLRWANQPINQRNMSVLIILMHIPLIVASIITSIFIVHLNEFESPIEMQLYACYIISLLIRSLIMIEIHAHCLYQNDLYYNSFSINQSMSLSHRAQYIARIIVRLESIAVFSWVITTYFDTAADLFNTSSIIVLVWLATDMSMILLEIMIYISLFRIMPWRSISMIAPFVPISEQMMRYLEGENQQVVDTISLRSGLSTSELDDIKRTSHSYVQMDDWHHTECSICLTDFEFNDTVASLKCGHTFHDACISRWLVQRGTCPYCVTRAQPNVYQSINQSINQPLNQSANTVESTSGHSVTELVVVVS